MKPGIRNLTGLLLQAIGVRSAEGQIYRAGRTAFHREVAARLAGSGVRSELDAAEIAWLADSTSGLFERVIYLGWQRDQPAFIAPVPSASTRPIAPSSTTRSAAIPGTSVPFHRSA